MKKEKTSLKSKIVNEAKYAWKFRTLLLMCLPAIVYVFIFCLYPLPGIRIAFVDYNIKKGISGSKFVGLKNFEFLWRSGKLWMLTRNNLLYNIAETILGLIMQVSVAVLLNEMHSKYFKKISQSIMFIPYFISWVLVGVLSFNIFNYEYGFINTILEKIAGEKFSFYSAPWVWPFILVAFTLWKSTGHSSIVYFAALCGIDSEILEAAKIDGASAWQSIRYIKLPMLKPTIVILLLLGMGGMLKGSFGLVYNVVGTNNARLWPTTDIIEAYVYRSMLNDYNFSTASAVGVYQSLFGMFLVLFSNWVVKKVNPDYALF